jgi:hypothetical protein
MDPRRELTEGPAETPHGPVCPARALFDRLVSSSGSPDSAQVIAEIVARAARLELFPATDTFAGVWDRLVLAAGLRLSLPGEYARTEAQNAIRLICEAVESPAFGLMQPPWQLYALADLATLASADRPGLVDRMMPTIRTLVSHLDMLKSGEAQLARFSTETASPLLLVRLADLPFGGVSGLASAGRIDWTCDSGPQSIRCTAWLAAAHDGAPALELWTDGRPLLTTHGPVGSSRALLEPKPVPDRINVRRRDDDACVSLEASCEQARAGRNLLQWGRTVRASRATGTFTIEDWLLAPRDSPTDRPAYRASRLVLGPDVSVALAADNTGLLTDANGQCWHLHANGAPLVPVAAEGGTAALALDVVPRNPTASTFPAIQLDPITALPLLPLRSPLAG